MESKVDVSWFAIDKENYKILKFIYRKKSVTTQELVEKFGWDGVSSVAILCEQKYAAYKSPEGTLVFVVPSPEPDGIFALTMIGKKYIEDRISTSIRWVVPILISLFSLAISFSTMVLTIFSKSEFWIHII